jgi:hypothetical protein
VILRERPSFRALLSWTFTKMNLRDAAALTLVGWLRLIRRTDPCLKGKWQSAHVPALWCAKFQCKVPPRATRLAPNTADYTNPAWQISHSEVRNCVGMVRSRDARLRKWRLLIRGNVRSRK